MRFYKLLPVLLLIGGSASSIAHAQTITNGDFPTDLSGWTTQGPNTFWRNDLGPDSLPGVAWLNDNPGPVAFIEQTITGLTPRQTYTINGFYKSLVIFAGTGSFTAQVDGTTEFANTDTSFVSNWTPFNFAFTPSATSATLRLNSQVGNDSDYLVDNISIQAPAPVPEPGSVTLLAGMGLSGAGFLARRKKARQAS